MKEKEEKKEGRNEKREKRRGKVKAEKEETRKKKEGKKGKTEMRKENTANPVFILVSEELVKEPFCLVGESSVIFLSFSKIGLSKGGAELGTFGRGGGSFSG